MMSIQNVKAYFPGESKNACVLVVISTLTFSFTATDDSYRLL